MEKTNTKSKFETGFDLNNNRWPIYIREVINTPEYKGAFTEESITFLKGMRFVDGKWLQNGRWEYFPKMELTLSYSGKELAFEGVLSEEKSGNWATYSNDVNREGIFGGEMFIPFGVPYLQKKSECVAFAEILTEFGLRDTLLRIDGDRWPVEPDREKELEGERLLRKAGEKALIEKMNADWPTFLEKELRSFDCLLTFSDTTLRILRGMQILAVEQTWNSYPDSFVGIWIEAKVDEEEYSFRANINKDESDERRSVFIVRRDGEDQLLNKEEERLLSSIWVRFGYIPALERLDAQKSMRDRGEELPF